MPIAPTYLPEVELNVRVPVVVLTGVLEVLNTVTFVGRVVLCGDALSPTIFPIPGRVTVNLMAVVLGITVTVGTEVGVGVTVGVGVGVAVGVDSIPVVVAVLYVLILPAFPIWM